MARLGDVCTIVSGSTPKTGVADYWDGNIKWITPAELNDESFYIYDSERHITDLGCKKTNLSPLPAGTVILSSRAPIGKTAIAGCEMCCNQGFKNLICSDSIYNEYLYFFLKGKTDYLNSLGRGATFKEISKTIVESINVPLPPLKEQEGIAEKFKSVNTLISLRQQQLEKLNQLVKSRFIEMFGDFETNPKGWRVSTLGDECYYIKDGPHKSPKYLEGTDGIPFISTRNVVNGDGIDWSTAKYISEEDYFDCIKKCHPERGDILYSKGGTTGVAKLVDTDKRFANWVHVAVLKFGDQFDGRFLESMLNMDYCYAQSQKLTKGIANRDFVLSAIAQVKIFVPPIELQREYTRFVEQSDKSKFEIQQSLEKQKPLKKR